MHSLGADEHEMKSREQCCKVKEMRSEKHRIIKNERGVFTVVPSKKSSKTRSKSSKKVSTQTKCKCAIKKVRRLKEEKLLLLRHNTDLQSELDQYQHSKNNDTLPLQDKQALQRQQEIWTLLKEEALALQREQNVNIYNLADQNQELSSSPPSLHCLQLLDAAMTKIARLEQDREYGSTQVMQVMQPRQMTKVSFASDANRSTNTRKSAQRGGAHGGYESREYPADYFVDEKEQMNRLRGFRMQQIQQIQQPMMQQERDWNKRQFSGFSMAEQRDERVSQSQASNKMSQHQYQESPPSTKKKQGGKSTIGNPFISSKPWIVRETIDTEHY